MLKHIIDPEVEEYEDVYDDHEYLAAQEMQQREGMLLKQGNEFKASTWLTPEDAEVVITLARVSQRVNLLRNGFLSVLMKR